MNKIIAVSLIVMSLEIVGCGQLTNTVGSIRPSKGTNDSAKANLELGIAYLQRGEYEKALTKLHKSLDSDSRYAPTYSTLGILYQKVGEKKKAEKYYKKALSLDGFNPSILNNYGQFLCYEARYDEGYKTFLKAANHPLYSTPDIAFTNAGLCAMLQGKLTLAESYFRSALEKNPGALIALIKMSNISYEIANYLSARAYLQRYLEIVSHTPESLWLGIRIERKLGDKDALSSYTLLLKNKFPNSKEVGFLNNGSL